MATLQDYLGGGLPAGLLTPEQEAAAEQRAARSGLLNLAFGLLQASRGAPGQGRPSLGQVIGQAGPVGVQAYQQSFDQTLQNALRGMQIQEMQRRQGEIERQRKARDVFAERMAALQGGVTTPSMALAGGGGPTQAAAERIGQPLSAADVARQQQAASLELLGQVAPEEVAKLAFREPKKEETFRPITEAERKSLNLPADTPYQVSSSGKVLQVGQGPLVKNIVGGQSGLDNEMKIRGAFSNEPVYKAYQEMRSAYGQITDSLKQASPAGDLAAATKFMKLLDPGSVVRESELYMAMQASGALDRFVNYANMRLSGQKLTQEQRKDFQSLADKLYGTAVNTFNQKRGEYADLAETYGLNPNRSVGSPAIVPETTQERALTAPPAPQRPGLQQMVLPSKAPAGVRQELWNVMTPEQRKLWQQ